MQYHMALYYVFNMKLGLRGKPTGRTALAAGRHCLFAWDTPFVTCAFTPHTLSGRTWEGRDMTKQTFSALPSLLCCAARSMRRLPCIPSVLRVTCMCLLACLQRCAKHNYRVAHPSSSPKHLLAKIPPASCCDSPLSLLVCYVACCATVHRAFCAETCMGMQNLAVHL